MKRFKKLVIGGIETKVFNLILLTVVLLTIAYLMVSARHARMLAQVVAESGERQQEAITEITTTVMDQVVTKSLARSNQTEAQMADRQFEDAGDRILFLADRATTLLADAGDYALQPYAGPDPGDDGTWTAKVIFAEGVDANDPAVAAKVGLMANLFDTMISLCPSFGASTVYIGLPEGVHLSVSDDSSSWFEDGVLRKYDPRTRGWYQKAAEAGGLIYTDGEWDANTGVYCVECAAPVYGPDGSLQAVVGTDLYLDEIQQNLGQYSVDGEYNLLVNGDGRAVLPMQAKVFPMADADREGDLRDSENGFLSQIVAYALQGGDPGVALGELSGGAYYVTASPIKSTGWILVSAYDQAVSNQPAAIMTGSLSRLQSQATATYREKTGHSRNTAIVLLLAVTLVTLAAALIVGKRIVRPLNTITQRITELSEDNLEFKMEDAYRTGDEVEALAESFAAISHKTVVYMDKVVKVTAEKERIGAELSLATEIQAAMMPHIFPPFPDRTEFDIYATMDPAKEVGGDFYDYFLIDDDHLCMVIADVSGKGVPAALFMMASKIILQSCAMLGRSPAQILDKTNEAICSNNEAEMFVTVWLGILEISTGRLTAANAGHEFPVFKRPDGPYELYKDKHGFVIGGMDGVKYREYELTLEPGSKLFVYTDGVPEATNADMELFGTQRMLDALNAAPNAAPRDTLKSVRRAVDGFVRDAEQFDDLTMLCMEYRGPERVKGEDN